MPDVRNGNVSCREGFNLKQCEKCLRVYRSCWMGIDAGDVQDFDDVYRPSQQGPRQVGDIPSSIHAMNVLQFASVLTGDRHLLDTHPNNEQPKASEDTPHSKARSNAWMNLKKMFKAKEDARVMCYYTSERTYVENTETEDHSTSIQRDDLNDIHNSSTNSSQESSLKCYEERAVDVPSAQYPQLYEVPGDISSTSPCDDVSEISMDASL